MVRDTDVNVARHTPEDTAREKVAERMLLEMEEERQLRAVPIGVKIREWQDSDTATSFLELAKQYPEDFYVEIALMGDTYKLRCKRKSYFDIFPDADRDEDTSMLASYQNAEQFLCAVIDDDACTPDTLRKLPNTLVTELFRRIQDEISPAFRDAADEHIAAPTGDGS